MNEDEIEWGLVIDKNHPTLGWGSDKPSWLNDGDTFRFTCHYNEWTKPQNVTDIWTWQMIVAIQLTYSHEVYKSLTEEWTPELIARAKQLVRDAAKDIGGSLGEEAESIMAALKPKDPLIEEIREQLGPKFKHLAEVVAIAYKKEMRD